MSKSVLYYTQRFNCNLPSAIVSKKLRKILHIENHAIYVQVQAVFQTLAVAPDLLYLSDGEYLMNKPENNSTDWKPLEFQQEVMQSSQPPSSADLLLMAKLFSLGDMGTWVRAANAPTSEPAKRVLRNWVRKGYVYYTQDKDTKARLLVLEDDCARMCGEAIAAAFEVRTARSMLDQKPESPKQLDPMLKGSIIALLLVISVELLLEFFK